MPHPRSIHKEGNGQDLSTAVWFYGSEPAIGSHPHFTPNKNQPGAYPEYDNEYEYGHSIKPIYRRKGWSLLAMSNARHEPKWGGGGGGGRGRKVWGKYGTSDLSNNK